MRTPHNERLGSDITDDGPERTCILSGQKAARDALVRLAVSPDGEVLPDALAKAPGRGGRMSALSWRPGMPVPGAAGFSRRRGSARFLAMSSSVARSARSSSVLIPALPSVTSICSVR